MSRKKIDNVEVSLSLQFSNNMFQIELFEYFEKNEIKVKTVELGSLNNIIIFKFKSEEFILLIFTNQSFLSDYMSNLIFEKLQKFPKNLVYLIFYESEEIIKEKYTDFKFFVQTQLRAKIYIANSKPDFFDYLSNLAYSITIKEEKAKITYFESKPTSHSNLCELENITENKQLTWIEHLMCIPGVSERKAISISKQYNNIKSLMLSYLSDEYSESEKENLLKNIEVINKTKNKVTKIGPSLSSKIYNFFKATDPNLIIN